MKRPVKQRAYLALRIVICAAALWFVLRGVSIEDRVYLRDGNGVCSGAVRELDDQVVVTLADGTMRTLVRDEVAVDAGGALRIEYGLRTSWKLGRKLLLVLAVVINLPVAFLLARRLKWMLAAQAIQLSYWDCVKMSFAGNFLNFATPLGSNAGDVFKAYFVSLHTDRKTEAVATVAMDRVIGLMTLVLVVAVISAWSPDESRLAEFRSYTVTFLVAGIVGAAIYFSPWPRKLLPLARWLERLPLATHLRRIDSSAKALAARPWILVGAVMTTVMLQALAMASYFVVAMGFGLSAHWGNAFEYYAYFSTGAVVQALPGPPQGLGTVELAYRYLLAPFGSPSQILCVAFFIRVLVLVCALPGGLVTLTGAYRPRFSEPDPRSLSCSDPSPIEP